MRRSLIMLPAVAALAAAAAFAALGCEDGPTQIYQPSPAGAASNQNGNGAPGTGTVPGSVTTDGGTSYDAGFPTVSKTVLCSTDIKRLRWAWMLTQPIQPPRFYAGLDMAKDDLWTGLKIDDAEQGPLTAPDKPGGGLCQSTPLGYEGSCPSGFGGCNGNCWGNNCEVIFSWNVATHLVDQMELQLGYVGTMATNMYPDHNGEMHSYTIAAGDVVRRDGAAFEIQWTDNATRALQITDIFNATMATFAQKAGVPFDTSTCSADTTCTAPGTSSICECTHVLDPVTHKPTPQCDPAKNPNGMGQCGIKNCGSDGNCLIYDDGSTTIFGIRPMVIYVQGQAGVPQPALSTPSLFYNFFSKWEPYSNLPQTVILDKDGPFAQGTPVGVPPGQTITCTQAIGQTFDDFVTNCVQVHGDKSNPNGVDAVNLNKVVHSLTHDQEHWTANVLGVNQNFTSIKVANNPNIVVLDSDAPGSGDFAQDWTFDVRARGHVHNDYGGAAAAGWPVPEYRGSALLFIEWARLLLADIGRITGTTHTLGDPACVGYDASGKPNYLNDPTCSGIEGMIIPNAAPWGGPQTDFTGDPKRPDLDAGNNYDQFGIFLSVLKPGDIHGAFCIDPGTFFDCTADGGFSVWQNALTHVRRVLGRGQLTNLPSELQDRRYYFKWFGIAFIKYLKAYGNYNPATRDNFPSGTVGSGLGPSDVLAQPIDLESLFFDYTVQPGGGGAQTFDKFEYIDRDFLGQGNAGTGGVAYNWIPYDFEYGCDLFGGNQRYDNWYRRMDREEIMMYSSMLVDKTHTAGQENNVNVTNLFGSVLLGGDPAAGVAGVWPSWACAVGQAGDPGTNCVSGFIGGPVNPPLDPTNPSGAPPCGSCGAGQACGGGNSFENGFVQACGAKCDFTTYPLSGCQSPSQTCAGGACLDMMMDKNGAAGNGHACTQATASKDCPNGNGCNATTSTCNPQPLLWAYPGAWSRTPFSRGHSPITLAATDKHPNIGVAKINIPNFVTDPKNVYTTGPYTRSPVPATAAGCSTGYTLSANKAWCNAAVNSGMGYMAPSFSALTPWLEVQPGVGFSLPIDAQHNQWVTTGQFDFTGVLETYIVDYLPYVDKAKPSCVTDGVCNTGFNCDSASKNCYTDDNTVQVAAIEGADFLGQAFACIDPWTSDILHVGMYDSAQSIVDWLANHPGGTYAGGVFPSAQAACQILVIRSPYDNYVDFVVSKAYGVSINIGGGQGQGRVTDIILWDTSLIDSQL